MTSAVALVALLGAFPALAQDDARFREGEIRQRASDVKLRCESVLADLGGVTSVGVGGSGMEYRLILVVSDLPTKMAARGLLGGDVFEGLKVIWSVSSPNAVKFIPAASAPPAPVWTPPAVPVPAAPTATVPAWTPPPPARRSAPVQVAQAVPAETVRTFYAGPMTLTPQRRSSYGYGGYSNCSPSRAGFLAVRCAPGYGGTPGGWCASPSGYGSYYGGTTGYYGGNCPTTPSYAYSRPSSTGYSGVGGNSGGVCYRPGRSAPAR